MIKQNSLKANILNTNSVNELIKLLKQETLFDIVDTNLFKQTGYHLRQDTLIQAKNDVLLILSTH